MRDLISLEELSQLIKNRRYIDVSIEDCDLIDTYIVKAHCKNAETQTGEKKIIVYGNNRRVHITILENTNYCEYEMCNYIDYSFCVEYISSDSKVSNKVKYGNQLNFVYKQLEKYDLYKEPPLIKKCNNV